MAHAFPRFRLPPFCDQQSNGNRILGKLGRYVVAMRFAHVEVPAEVVGIIAHHLFCLEGMRETWKQRLVCTTFASAIKDDILLYQTEELRYADRRWCGSIMSHLMPEWLYYRVKKPVDSMSSLSVRKFSAVTWDLLLILLLIPILGQHLGHTLIPLSRVGHCQRQEGEEAS